MKKVSYFLIASTVIIYGVTVLAIQKAGFNWPIFYFGDMLKLDWRSQFNTDFLIHLLLLASWISWREGFTVKGHVFGFLSIIMGGMFGFPYILVAIYRAKGNPQKLLLGVHSKR